MRTCAVYVALVLVACGRIEFVPVVGDAAGGAPCASFGPWEPPVLIPEVSTADEEYAPSLSADGRDLLFASDRPGGFGGLDLYVAKRPANSGPFDVPVNLGVLVNSAGNDGSPSLSTDALTLYFDSDRGGAGFAMFTTTRQDIDLGFGAAAPLQVTPVGFTDTGTADISVDDLTLYFSSSGPGSLGGADLWTLTRADPTSPWGAVTNLTSVNSSANDTDPSITSTGLELFFRSDRIDPAGDELRANRADPTAPFGTPTLDPVASVFAVGEYGGDVSIDGMTMVMSLHESTGLGKTDIWMTTRSCLDPEQ